MALQTVRKDGIYLISTLLAAVTGLMPMTPFVAATMLAMAANAPIGYIFLLITGAWVICTLMAIGMVGSSRRSHLWFSIASSSIVSLLSGYGVILLATGQKLYDPLYFTAPVSLWVWEAVPFVFNALQLILSILRYQRLSTSEVRLCPQ